jgi:beta-lactamase class A
VVKVPIGLEFYAQAAAKQLNPNQIVTLDSDHRTPGPVGISQFEDPVSISLRDLSYLMLTISDNAATDAVTAAVGVSAVNDRLKAVGCDNTVVAESLQEMLDGVAHDMGHHDYRELVAAQSGLMGSVAQAKALDPDRVERCRALDPLQTSRTTARDATRLLTAIWNGDAASPEACINLRQVMAQQVTRRLARATLDGRTLEAKSGSLFKRVRNEIALVIDPGGETYSVAVFTRTTGAPGRPTVIDEAMSSAVVAAVEQLRT